MTNTETIIAWVERMMDKTGLCGAVLPEALADFCQEAGAEEPSDTAIAIAKSWEDDPELMFEFIRNSGRWCQSPTWGCRFTFSKPCAHMYGPTEQKRRSHEQAG